MLLDKKLIFVLCLTMLVSLHVFSQSENNNGRQKPRRPAMKLLEQKKNKLDSLATFKRNERIRLENENAKLEKEIEQQKQLYTTELSQADNELHKQKENINRMSAEQARMQLTLNVQKMLADSLAYASRIDSLLIKGQTAKITQQNIALENANTKEALQKSQRNLFFVIATLGLLLAATMYYRYASANKFNKQLLVEQEKSENLLLNILPKNVANELKQTGKAQAQNIPQATVMFTDFVDFTKVAETLTPTQLINELDYCYRKFDAIMTKYTIEKIKTIGDAYMAVAGLDNDNQSHIRIVNAAIEIIDAMIAHQHDCEKLGKPFFKIRIGLHTGPLVAGVVGGKKFSYDVYGDTVNIAARMESSSEEGKINISTTTYNLVHNNFTCTPRGKISAKNKGEMEMYFVEKI